ARLLILFSLLLFQLVISQARAEAPTGEALRIQRLIGLCKLWGTVRYLHPYLFYKDIDWDAALVAAIPKVRAAQSTDEYAAALGAMLASLGDPLTVIERDQLPARAEGSPGQTPPPLSEWLNPKTLLIRMNDVSHRPSFQQLEQLKPEIDKA